MKRKDYLMEELTSHFNAGAYKSVKTVSFSSSIVKVMSLLSILLISTFFSRTFVDLSHYSYVYYILGLGSLLTFIGVSIKKMWAKWLAIPFAMAQGVLIGGVFDVFFAQNLGTFVMSLVLSYVSMLLILWFFFEKNINIKSSNRPLLTVGFLCLFSLYATSILLQNLGMDNFISTPDIYGVFFSGVVILLLSICLISDLNFIYYAEKKELSKDLEWYLATGILVSLSWINFEILSLYLKAQRGIL